MASSGSTDRPPGNRAGKEGNMSGMARLGGLAAAIILLTWISAGSALAHCDTMDGPVVILAKKALEKGDVTLVLPWVAKEKEGEIREAFDLTSAVRGRGAKEKELADRYFFETLVRVHREAEGAPFTGLKPAGLDLGPAIPAADKALETGNPKPLLALIEEKIHEGIHRYYVEAMERKKHAGESMEAGREAGGGARAPTPSPHLPASTRTEPPAGKPRRHRPRRKIMRYLILGGGPAGIAAAKAVRKREKDAAIVIATEESASPYLRPLLPDFISGDTDLSALADPQGEDLGPKEIEYRKGKRARKVYPGGSRVIFEDGSEEGYAFLLVATGGKPILPVPLKKPLGSILPFDSLDDARRIRDRANRPGVSVVYGPGYLAIEACRVLRKTSRYMIS